jgi:hypothetical protein
MAHWFTRLLRRDREPDVRRILEAYGACLDRAAEPPYRHERELPYSKEEIGRALLTALKFADRRETRAPLRHGFVELERFLGDDEWRLCDEHDRLASVGGLRGGMSAERRAAAAHVLEAIEARRARRVQLLEIIEAEQQKR